PIFKNMKTNFTFKILDKALMVMETKGWCKRRYAIDENKNSVEVTSRNAVAFCALGALLYATNKVLHIPIDDDQPREASQAFEHAERYVLQAINQHSYKIP